MKQLLYLCVFLTLFSNPSSAQGAEINWNTHYDKAVKEAQAANKPLLLFFTEPGCRWCKKLNSESLSTPEFAQKAGNSFVFVKVDFPKGSHSNTQNEELQKKYKVRGFPTIILLSPDEQQIGITGYRPGGGNEYADHLLKMTHDYSDYKSQMSALKSKNLSAEKLKTLYEQAKCYQFSEDTALIVKKGMETDEAFFFTIEQIKELASKDQLDSREAITLKKRVLKDNPNNENQVAFHLAVLEFEKRYQEMKKNNRSAESATEPLVSYVEKYGNSDSENAWRLNMLISQVLFDQHHFSEALKYAKQSYDVAPDSHQLDIAEAISDINDKVEYYR